jgi:hypothetical protein
MEAEAALQPQRQPVVLTLQRPRRDFGQARTLTDVDAQDLWNSAQNECRPFKDIAYDLQLCERQAGVQAVPELVDCAVQVGRGRAAGDAHGAWR